MTDWVLWTRNPISRADQKWFYGIKTSMARDLNTASDVEDLLNGEGLLFRSTYFGELVLTPCLLNCTNGMLPSFGKDGYPMHINPSTQNGLSDACSEKALHGSTLPRSLPDSRLLLFR